MRAEYRFDHAKAKPNRFASRMKTGAVAVILDPDVASVFRSSDAVNTLSSLRHRADSRVEEQTSENQLIIRRSKG
jgi:hypothetical protein